MKKTKKSRASKPRFKLGQRIYYVWYNDDISGFDIENWKITAILTRETKRDGVEIFYCSSGWNNFDDAFPDDEHRVFATKKAALTEVVARTKAVRP